MRTTDAPALLLILGAVGCGWGHPAARPAPPPVPAIEAGLWPPAGALAHAEGLGARYLPPPSAAEAETSSVASIAAEEPLLPGERVVEPVLTVTGTVVTFDLPMSDDPMVEAWVERLQRGGRKRAFKKWLGRSTRYVPLFWEILEQYDVPKDLVFLSMVESGFSPRAYSWAHAAGPWQFMPYTGRRFGLEVGFWVDERRDFVKSTHAAAQYLSRLHALYDGDWLLAMAAYNGGPGKVSRALRRTGAEDFWTIARTWRLRRETRNYVPKILAAARVSKQPEVFGFEDVAYLPPLEWGTVTVTVATDLEALAGMCGLDEVEVLGRLNPELRCGVTPPGRAYALRVPKGAEAACAAGLRALNPAVRTTYRYHLLRPQETLEDIAIRYRTTAAAILRFNRMDPEQLHDTDELIVPVPYLDADEVPFVVPDPRKFRAGSYRPDGQQLLVHRVRSGDSLWRIARRYRVSLRKLRLWNGLWRSNNLRIGQKLKIYLGRGRR